MRIISNDSLLIYASLCVFNGKTWPYACKEDALEPPEPFYTCVTFKLETEST